MGIIRGNPKVFYQLLVNTLLVSVINFTVWFAITFYVYLQTRSVFATGVIAGIFLVLTATTGIWFGSLVDHHAKKTMMQLSAALSLLLYGAAFVVYQVVPHEQFTDPASVGLWTLVVLLMFGVIAGNIRTIALPTLVTVLIAEETRDRANGLVGTTSGVSFLVTSVISGLLVALNGMFWVLILALAVLAVALAHLALVAVPARPDAPAGPGASADSGARTVDLRGTMRVIGEVPGLSALILFSAFNNFLGGVFMALLDAYGLSLVSVQTWGLLWGVLSTGFIIGGLFVARTGLSRNPVRLLLLVNLVLWIVTALFPLRSSIILVAVGLYVYMLLVPYAEAAEQTDRQPTEHRRDRERDAVDGPDETVRLVVAILGHEQRDRRRQGDGAQVPGDRAGQHEGDEGPERGMPEVLERPVRGDDVQRRGEEVRHQRAGARHQHRRLAPMVVDVGAEEQG